MSEELKAIGFREKLDISEIVLRQLDRTNTAASYDYENSVRQKLNQLPQIWRKWVIDQDDKYSETKNVFTFENPSGFAEIGSIDNPELKDDRRPVRRFLGEVDWTDPNIKGRKNVGTKEKPEHDPVLIDESKPVKRLLGPVDWNDPNIWSPKLTREVFIDYSLMDALIMDALEQVGLTWNVDAIEVDAGDTEEFIKEYVERKKTPFLPQKLALQEAKEAIEDEEPEDDEEE